MHAEAAPAPLDLRTDGWASGPRRLVLFGPPGTGKTRSALDGWLAPALRDGVPPGQILATSFTNAAADELASRLGRAVPEADELGVCASTIHAEALRSLPDAYRLPVLGGSKKKRLEEDEDPDEEGSKLVGSGDRRLLTAALTVWDFARATMAPGDTTLERIEAVQHVFSDDRRLAEFSAEDLAREVELYEKQKIAAKKIDFSDMLELAAKHGDARWRALLIVDEAQDLSALQWSLVGRWIEAAERVVLIADPDQCIHEWAGADSHPIIRHARSGEWAVRRLAKSHRVPRAAHRIARALILEDEDRIDAPYEPADREGQVEEASVREAVDALEQAARDRVDVLALSRSKRLLSERLGDELVRRGVPHVSERGYSPLGAPSVVAAARAIIDLQKGLAKAGDVAQLLTLLPARGHFPSKRKKDLVDAVSLWPAEALVRPASLEALGISVRAFLGQSLGEALRALQGDKGGRKTGRDRATALELLVELHGDQVLRETPTVILTTLHASKGREADLVVLDLAMPKATAHALAEGRSTASERRLLYVGLTRTKDRMLLLRDGAWDLGRALRLGV